MPGKRTPDLYKHYDVIRKHYDVIRKYYSETNYIIHMPLFQKCLFSIPDIHSQTSNKTKAVLKSLNCLHLPNWYQKKQQQHTKCVKKGCFGLLALKDVNHYLPK